MNVRRVVLVGASALAGIVGLIGLLHVPAFSPVLEAVARLGGCPVSFDGGDPAAVEAFRVRALQARRGEQMEKARPALGFELGTTTRQALEQSLQGRDCEWIREGSAVKCGAASAPDGDMLPITDFYAQFDGEGRLVALDVFRSTDDAGLALDQLGARAQDLTARVGPATEQVGQAGIAELQRRYLARVAHNYRYHGYMARLSATNLGARGIRLREQYQLVSDPKGT